MRYANVVPGFSAPYPERSLFQPPIEEHDWRFCQFLFSSNDFYFLISTYFARFSFFFPKKFLVLFNSQKFLGVFEFLK